LAQASAAASGSSGSNVVVHWSRISETISNRVVIDPAELKVYMRFVQMFGAGPFLSDLDMYHKTYVPTNRVIPIGTFSSIVDLKLAPSEIAPHMAIAIIKAQGSCPEAKVSNKICRFISNGDIAALAGAKKAVLLAAEALLRESRSLVKAFEIPSSVAAKPLSRLDTLAARFAAVAHRSDSWIDNVQRDFRGLYGALTWRPGRSTTVSLMAEHGRTTAVLSQGMFIDGFSRAATANLGNVGYIFNTATGTGFRGQGRVVSTGPAIAITDPTIIPKRTQTNGPDSTYNNATTSLTIEAEHHIGKNLHLQVTGNFYQQKLEN